MSEPGRIFRFAEFELDTAACELRRGGARVKLPPQPFKVLELLVSHAGEVLTRADIRERVWCDSFVDFEQGLNFCIREIRKALGDNADSPRFIETLPRRGYRFLIPVETSASAPNDVRRLIVLPFRMLRPDPGKDFLAFSLPDALTTSLSVLNCLIVRSSLAAAPYASGSQDLKTIAAETEVDLIVTGTLLSAGEEIRAAIQLTEAASGTLLWSHSTQISIDDVFRLHDELTERVISSLSLPLSATEQRTLRRDVPADPAAYEYYLRANQFSNDPKQWESARDLYLRCVAADPVYAPAWARLGRIHHVMAKYLPSGSAEGLRYAEAAFRQALDLNPDLAIGHKFYAQLEVDTGRAGDALARLLPRAEKATDPEIFAALISPLRYCGLLAESAAAYARAAALDSKIRTSVAHTWFLQRDYVRVASTRLEDNPYVVAMSLAELGRGQEALPVLGALEEKVKTRMRDFIVAARCWIEGDAGACAAAITRIVDSGFSDPEALLYLARHLAHLNQPADSLALLQRVITGGHCCYPALAADPWLDPIRNQPEFATVLDHARQRQQIAAAHPLLIFAARAATA